MLALLNHSHRAAKFGAALVVLISITPCREIAAQAIRQSSGTGSITIITGTITGPNSVIVAGATISAMSPDSVTRRATSNDKGKYQFVFPNGGASYHVTVSAPGYLPWSGDVRKAYSDDRITADVSLREDPAGKPPAAAPKPGEVHISRAQLGAADAIEVDGDVAIAVMGSSGDEIIYRTYTGVTDLGNRGCGPTMPTDAPVPMMQLTPSHGTMDFGPGGLSIKAAPGEGAFLIVPRSIKRIRVVVRTEGRVVISDLQSDVSVQSASGPICLSRVSGLTLLEARNGTIGVTLPTIPSAINILGHNGDIVVNAPIDARASISAEVHGGNITLDSTSRLVLPTGRWSAPDIEVFRRDVPPADKATKLPWVLNGGGAAITVTSLNGNIIIRRAAPPKTE